VSLAFDRIRVYVRLALVFAAVGAIVLVLFMNRNHNVTVWCFWITDQDKPVNVVWLMLGTAAATLVSWWALSFGWGLWRDMRKVQRETVQQEAEKTWQKRAADLGERERRIDAKLKEAISTDGNDEDGT